MSMVRENKYSVYEVVDASLSLLFGLLSLVPALKGNYLFFTFFLLGLSVGATKLVSVFCSTMWKPSPYNGIFLRGLSLFCTVFALDFGLLFMIFWTPKDSYATWLMFGVFVFYGLIRLGSALSFFFVHQKEKSPISFARSLSDFTEVIFAGYGALIVALDQFQVGRHFDGLFIGLLALNAILTLGTLLLSAPIVVVGKEKRPLGFKEGMFCFWRFVISKSIFFFVAMAFCLLLALLAFLDMFQNPPSGFLALFHLVFVIASVFFFVWNKLSSKNRRHYSPEEVLRRKHKMEIFASAFLFAVANLNLASAIVLWQNGANRENYSLFGIAFLSFFAVWRILAAIISGTAGRKENNPYDIVSSALSLVAGVVSMVSVVSQVAGAVGNEIFAFVLAVNSIWGVVALELLLMASLLIRGIRGIRRAI